MTVHRPPAPSRELFFFRQFLKSPGSIGSVIPTSRAAIRAMLDPVDWSAAHCVVEYGPGTGVFTRALLARLGPDARLIAIDTNPDFTTYLRKAIHDPRLILVDGNAANIEKILAVHGFTHADYVISGLPFSTIPQSAAQAILDATARAVRPGGAFLVYQYSLCILPRLAQRFARVDLGRAWRCLPPARLFYAWKTT
jgi:phospholipid N-methyltransferase